MFRIRRTIIVRTVLREGCPVLPMHVHPCSSIRVYYSNTGSTRTLHVLEYMYIHMCTSQHFENTAPHRCKLRDTVEPRLSGPPLFGTLVIQTS